MRRRHYFSALLLTSLTACASAPINPPLESSGDETARYSRSSDLITASELATTDPTDALQAITRLRPFFLRRAREMNPVRPNQSFLTVYLDNIKLGGIETLQGIPIEALRSIRYLSATEATIRYGTNHAGGVIQLTTK